ncbi:M14 family zinc carboxypeptidase [Lentzea flaviverrucosa]|uniref:Zinc carboxypeptidase n=1 Tax=Lentzea flaviverrucosa TaxID=200379 RepID=A0A1H9XKH7_9PSEU|nr:M14 family zinc carboxypeptidase [Lentzea flaviverrucosa]RDI20317.1 zinc carboxypeptidase [Lentzea flaviverrucosa]SES46549.1 Zinc carboxypeptidase [Lentzea flaviverrucosa]
MRGLLIALLTAVSSLAAVPAVAAPAPRTGFELTGKWTTESEEQAYLRATGLPVSQIGTTAQGRPIQLVRVGSRSARTVVLLICSQHGDEPAGREACLIRMRSLPRSSGTTYLFVPNANPDGRAADTRGNSAGVDINRDHLLLRTAEARAMASVIRDWQPDVIHDLHEFGPSEPYYVKDVLWLWPRNLNVADGVHDLSETLSRSYVRPSVEAAGRTSGVYGIYVDPVTGEPVRQVAGDGQERILRNTGGLKHGMGLLVETNVDNTPLFRVDSHLKALDGTQSFVGSNRSAIEAANAQSRAVRSGPVYFGGADNQAPDPSDVVATPPCGYVLTGAQYRDVQDELALHGVKSQYLRGGDRIVPLEQEARALVPLLMDARADEPLLKAQPVAQC